jgi:hypothetical protein
VKGESAGRFQALGRIGFTKSQDTETGSESMVRMDVIFEQMGNQLFGMGSIFGSPSDDP